jgi:hypothetical protein
LVLRQLAQRKELSKVAASLRRKLIGIAAVRSLAVCAARDDNVFHDFERSML